MRTRAPPREGVLYGANDGVRGGGGGASSGSGEGGSASTRQQIAGLLRRRATAHARIGGGAIDAAARVKARCSGSLIHGIGYQRRAQRRQREQQRA